MPGSNPIPQEAVAAIAAWCASRVEDEHTDDLRIEHETDRSRVTIVERRPPWDGGPGEWTRTTVAQLRYASSDGHWSLFCADGNGRWCPYDDAPASSDVSTLLEEIDDDPTGIFWG